MASKFYDNLPNPPLSERAIETAKLIETRTGDEGDLYRRWVAIQIDEARADAFIGIESEQEKLRADFAAALKALSAVEAAKDIDNARWIASSAVSRLTPLPI